MIFRMGIRQFAILMETVRKRLLAATLYDPQGTLQRINPQPHHRMAATDPAYPCQKTAALSVLHRQIQIIHLTENMKTIPMPSTTEGIRLERFKKDLIVPQTRAKEKIHRQIWMIEN